MLYTLFKKCYTPYTIQGFIVYLPPPIPPYSTTVSESLPPLITVVTGVFTSVITLPSLARAARALMALSKLSADDEHGIILGQRAAPRRHAVYFSCLDCLDLNRA